MPKSASRKTRKQKPKKIVKKVLPANDQSEPILSAWQLLKCTTKLLWNNKKLFASIIGIIGVVQLLVVQGIVRTDFVAVDQEIRTLVGSSMLGLGSGLTSYAYLLGSSGQGSGTGLLQSLFVVLTILAVIWALRELTAGNKPRIRDAFYKSPTPLVPFILISLWMAVQMLPALLGAWLYSVVTANNIAVHWYEQILWPVVFIGLTFVSLRFITSTLFALIISTLHDMTPVAAIRSARNLVQGRRLLIIKKLLFLSVTVLVLATSILVPAIIIAPVIVPLLFYCTGLLLLCVAVSYVYVLYKELLK